jgi:hypothetical protein
MIIGGSGSHMTSLFTEPNHLTAARELKSLYDYVVHILPEQEIGYFANGNGCLSSSNINLNSQTSTSVRFKYPLDANDELTLKYFCFPDQHDSNNNQNLSLNFTSNKSKPEYFRFTLTDMRGTRQYGYCSRFIHKGILNALCIVSPCDMMDLYEKILSTATELFLSYKDEDAKKFFKEIYPHRLPNRGDTIHIHTTTVGLYTLKCEYDRRKQLIDSVTLLNLSTGMIMNRLEFWTFFSGQERNHYNGFYDPIGGGASRVQEFSDPDPVGLTFRHPDPDPDLISKSL